MIKKLALTLLLAAQFTVRPMQSPGLQLLVAATNGNMKVAKYQLENIFLLPTKILKAAFYNALANNHPEIANLFITTDITCMNPPIEEIQDVLCTKIIEDAQDESSLWITCLSTKIFPNELLQVAWNNSQNAPTRQQQFCILRFRASEILDTIRLKRLLNLIG